MSRFFLNFGHFNCNDDNYLIESINYNDIITIIVTFLFVCLFIYLFICKINIFYVNKRIRDHLLRDIIREYKFNIFKSVWRQKLGVLLILSSSHKSP